MNRHSNKKGAGLFFQELRRLPAIIELNGFMVRLPPARFPPRRLRCFSCKGFDDQGSRRQGRRAYAGGFACGAIPREGKVELPGKALGRRNEYRRLRMIRKHKPAGKQKSVTCGKCDVGLCDVDHVAHDASISGITLRRGSRIKMVNFLYLPLLLFSKADIYSSQRPGIEEIL